MAEKRICPNCGHIGRPATVTKGSLAIEILLWLCFLVPGLIYSLWRQSSKYEACAKCNATNLMPVDTPRGQQLAQQFHGMSPTAARNAGDSYRGDATRGVVYLALIVLAVAYAIYVMVTR
jgi:hypothetical protein